MAAHQRRKGHRPTEREMNLPWRNPSPRPSSPASPLLNGNAYSPHTPRKRESSASPVDQEYKKNVDFLSREWQKVQSERSKKESSTVTDLVIRDQEEKESQPFDLDAFLENLHQRQQQQQ